VYAWTQVDTIRVSTGMSCQDFQQSSLQFTRAPVTPRLPSGVPFLGTRTYQLPGATILEHRNITIRGVFRGVVVSWGRVIYAYR